MKARRSETEEFLTTSQLAEILGVSRIAVYKKIKKGEIKASRIGNIYVIPKSYISEVFGRSLSTRQKKIVEEAVHKAVKEYGEVLIKLGNE